ncbi:MAG: toll/interleukin-1 receptor domain-containing protein [Ignavibacterium sp.]
MQIQKKETIFIAHASEDTYFAVWLKNKLELLGYTTFCDVEDLGSGSFWNEIDSILSNKTAKFIPVITSSYILKSKNPGTGVSRELARVMTLLPSNPKLVIPVRIDNSNWNEFDITIVGFEGANFSDGWAEGLKKLLTLLKRDEISPKKSLDDALPIIDDWYKALKIKENILLKDERYFTNWFPLSMPPSIYVYDMKFGLDNSPHQLPFAKKVENNLIITFCQPEEVQNYLEYESYIKLSTNCFFEHKPIQFDNERVIKVPNKKLVEILNLAFSDYLNSVTKKTRLSGNKEIFYFTKKDFVDLGHLGKYRRQLSGKEKGYTWHFAIGVNAFLFPLPAYFITSHIVFSTEDGKLLEKDLRIHKLRRKIATNWYNRKWFELLLAAMTTISNVDDKSKVIINLASNSNLTIETLPLEWNSRVGYKEPEKIDEE